MTFTSLAIPGVVLIEPSVQLDARGFFFESYHRRRFAENGVPDEFVQDNHSRSQRGVLRGLHYQIEPQAQAKLIRVVRGAIFDVGVDLRADSDHFGRWVGEILSSENRRQLFLPAGFAHGFCALEDGTEVLYKVTAHYSLEHERGLIWNDPHIGIRWPDLKQPFLVSTKDLALPSLQQAFPAGK